MRVAIVRLTAMGDVIHTLASLQFLKACRPDLSITWFVEEKFAGILEHNPHVDKIVPLPLHDLKKGLSIEKLSLIRKRIKSAGPFDLVVDVQGLIKSALVARTAGRPVAGLDFDSAREGVASLLYTRRFRIDCAGVAPMRFASLLGKALECPVTEAAMAAKEPYLFFDEEAVESGLKAFFDTKRKNVLLVTGASNASKTYPTRQWIDVARRLAEHNVLLIAGSEKEREEARKIEKASEARLLPRADLNALKYLVARSDLLIGGDTGPSHIAWALNRPSILLFGSTPKSMMFETPINIALTSGAPVHPCRFDKSDRSIAAIAPERIAEAARKVLA